jgi:hypothetical protein
MMMTKMCMFGWDVKTLLGVMPHAERWRRSLSIETEARRWWRRRCVWMGCEEAPWLVMPHAQRWYRRCVSNGCEEAASYFPVTIYCNRRVLFVAGKTEGNAYAL